MFHYSDIKDLHVEITSNCQASCPFCPRNVRGGKINPRIDVRDWTIDDFKRMISEKDLKILTSINFCGNYGDPAINNDLPQMLDYIHTTNKKIRILLSSNASMRNTKWWADIAKHFTDHSEVRFALDGLEDTHSRHRIGTSFNKVIENARAFIDAGGNATWFFIRFKHNQHQVNEAKSLSIKYGFKNFMMIDSQRFEGEDSRIVLNRSGLVIDKLEPADGSVLEFIPKLSKLGEVEELIKDVKISCDSNSQKTLYIDYNGYLFPCCYTASTYYRDVDPYNTTVTKFAPVLRNQIVEATNRLGGLSAINCKIRSIEEIISSPEWNTVWEEMWKEKKLYTCIKECGNLTYSKRSDQLVEFTKLE